MVETRRGERSALVGREIVAEVPFDSGREALPLERRRRFRDRGRLHYRKRVELGLDDRPGDRVLRVEGGETPDEVLELPDVAWPTVALQPLHGLGVQLLSG